MGSGDQSAFAGNEASLDGVLKLPDVSRPRVSPQQLDGVPTQRDITPAHLGRERPHERVGQEQHVVSSFPEWGQVHVEDAQPVEEIVAEPPGRHLGHQVTVGGGDQAEIGLERRGPPDPLELSLLKHSEELDLHRGGELSDLVEEERSVGRQLEASGLLPVRPGEGAALVAEQLGLEQRVGQRRAVDRDEGAVGAGAGVVNGAGDQFLPRPALPGEQHRRLRSRHLSRPGQRLAQERGVPDHLIEPVSLVQLAPGTLQALLQRLGRGAPPRRAAAVPRPGAGAGSREPSGTAMTVATSTSTSSYQYGSCLPKNSVPPTSSPKCIGTKRQLCSPAASTSAVAGPGGIELLRRLVEEDRPTGHQRRRVGELSGGDALNAGHWRLPGRSEERPLRQPDVSSMITPIASNVDRRPDRLPERVPRSHGDRGSSPAFS